MEHSLKLENQLCFPLYACSKEVIKKYKPFLDEIDSNAFRDVHIFVPYRKCFNLDSNERAYVIRIINGWYSNNFNRYFGQVTAADTGAQALEDEDRPLTQDDFNDLFLARKNTNELKNSGYPRDKENLDTIYGVVEILTALNKANLAKDQDRDENVTADKIIKGIQNLKSSGDTKSIEQIKKEINKRDFIR